MQRLGKNIGNYLGETIDITSVLRDIQDAAQRAGWQSDPISNTPELPLQAWRRNRASGSRRIYISTGIHGDEPAGPLAVLQLLRENLWSDDAELWLCPCLNPTGFPLNRRENAQGIDLNRQYLHAETPETRAHIAWLQRQPDFHLALCLHEDWEAHGFYLYELNPDKRPSQARKALQEVSALCPIDLSPVIEGRPADGGLIHPNIDPLSRPLWPEAFWLLQHRTRHSLTLEAPSDFPLPTRVQALVTATRTLLEPTH